MALTHQCPRPRVRGAIGAFLAALRSYFTVNSDTDIHCAIKMPDVLSVAILCLSSKGNGRVARSAVSQNGA